MREHTDVVIIGSGLGGLSCGALLARYGFDVIVRAGQATFPGAKTPLVGLLCCGDSTFPGIGVPGVAASGMIAAHTLAPVSQQVAMLQEVGL